MNRWEVIQPAEEGGLEVSYRWFRTSKDAEDWCMRNGAGVVLTGGSGTFPHTPTLCILTGTEPAVTDFQLPFFSLLNQFPPVHVAVSGDNKPKEVKAANVSHPRN